MDSTVIEQRLTVLTRQRVAAGAGGPRAQHVAAHSFIPGSVLRGALAAAWVAARGGRGLGFSGLFEGPLRYSAALPDGSVVEPASRRWEKYPCSGKPARWFDVATGRCGHGDDCPHGCAGFAAEWRQEHHGLRAGDNGRLQVVTSTAIDSVSGGGRHGHLFSHAALERDVLLRAAARGPVHAVEALRDLLADGMEVVLGGRGSVFGESVVSLDGTARPWPARLLMSSAARFLLLGPTLLVDDAGAPSADMAGVVAASLGVDRGRVTAWSRPSVQPWGGWHTASGTRKPTDLALEAGAVAVVTGLTTDEAAACERLVAAGLGLRRAEGFGWVELLGPHDDVLTVGPYRDPEAEDQACSSHDQERGSAASAFAALLAALDAAALDRRQRAWLVDRLRGAKSLDVDATLAEATPAQLPAAARRVAGDALRAARKSGRVGNALAAVLEDRRFPAGPRREAEGDGVPARGKDRRPEPASVPSRRLREVYPFAGEPVTGSPPARPRAVEPVPAPAPVDLRDAPTRLGGVRTHLRVEIELLSAFHVGRSASGHEDVGTGALRAVLTTRAADGVEEYCVPASQVRGSLRAHLAASDPSTAARLFGPAPEDAAVGTGLHASCWRVLGTRLDGMLVLDTRTQTVIDRVRRAPTAGRLRQTQVVVPIADPATRRPPLLVVYLACDIADADIVDPLVQALGTWDPHVGAARGSGLGRCRLREIRRLTLSAADPAHLMHRLRHGNGPDALDLLLTAHGHPQPVPGPADTRVLEVAFTFPHGWQPQRASATSSAADEPRRRGEPPLTMAGSRWRGLLRSRVEFIGRSLGLPACDSSLEACGACDVCAAFGSPQAAGVLDVEDLPVQARTGDRDVRRRTRVAINRFTGGAADDRLFAEESRHGDQLVLRVHARRDVPDWVARACLHTVRDLAEGLVGVGLASGTGLGTLHATSVLVRGPWAQAAGRDGETELTFEEVAAIAVPTAPRRAHSASDSQSWPTASLLDHDQEGARA